MGIREQFANFLWVAENGLTMARDVLKNVRGTQLYGETKQSQCKYIANLRNSWKMLAADYCVERDLEKCSKSLDTFGTLNRFLGRYACKINGGTEE